MFDLDNKVAVITGSARGLGQAIALKLAKAGADIALCDLQLDWLGESEELVKNTGVNAKSYSINVSDNKSVIEGIKKIESDFGKIDILVNNAGITKDNLTLRMKEEEWRDVIDVNLNSVFYCCKAVVPFMLKNDYGRIVNIASIAGKEGNPNASAYSTSKAGVIGLTKSLGKELAQKNIAVNCVTPAAAKTRIFDQMTEEHINYMLSKIPRNKFAKVEELASLVTWLASEENSFSTAAVFDLSGGRATY